MAVTECPSKICLPPIVFIYHPAPPPDCPFLSG